MTEGGRAEPRVLDIILTTLERMAVKLDAVALDMVALRQSHEDMCRRVRESESELAAIEDMIIRQGRDLDKHNKLWDEHLSSHARLEAPIRYVVTAVLTALALLVFYWILGGGMMPLL